MRRRRVVKRELTPDVKYNSLLVARLINTIMTRGKKSTAQGIVYSAFELMEAKKPEMPAIDIFTQALENVKPKVEVKSRRVGGATYQVPIDVDPERQVALAMRWITTYSRGRKGKSMVESLAGELLDAFDNTASSHFLYSQLTFSCLCLWHLPGPVSDVLRRIWNGPDGVSQHRGCPVNRARCGNGHREGRGHDHP